MSASDRELVTTEERNLHAYHDGQLGIVARWRFERRLERSPALRSQLEQIAELGEWVRDADSQPSPELWERIALQLPSIDAQRADPEADRSGLLDTALGQTSGWPRFRPVLAVAFTAVVAIAVALGTIEDGAGTRAGAVRWLDTGGRSVIVLDNPDSATIVWLLESSTGGA